MRCTPLPVLGAFDAARIEKLKPDLGRRESHAIELEVAFHHHLASFIVTWQTGRWRRSVAAVAGPVNHGGRRRQPRRTGSRRRGGLICRGYDLAGAGGGAAHAVDVLALEASGRAADHAQQQAIAEKGVGGQRISMEEHAFAAAVAHVDGGNFSRMSSAA
jgi:hypothetical protein